MAYAEAEVKYRARNAKRDANEGSVVNSLEIVGAIVFRLSQPCDLLVRHARRLYLMDVSNPENRYRKRDEKQRAMFNRWGVIEVSCADEALRAIGVL